MGFVRVRTYPIICTALTEFYGAANTSGIEIVGVITLLGPQSRFGDKLLVI